MVLNVWKPLSGPPALVAHVIPVLHDPWQRINMSQKGETYIETLTSCFPFFPEIFPCSGREELQFFRTFQMY